MFQLLVVLIVAIFIYYYLNFIAVKKNQNITWFFSAV